MVRSRILPHAAARAAVILASIVLAGAAAAEGKAPEVSTVGTAPAVLTAGERAKLAQLERLAEARATTPAKPVRGFARELLSPVPPVETRIPSIGPRDRTKPAETTTEVRKGDGR